MILRRKKRKCLETRVENIHTNLRHNPFFFWKDVREPNKATTAGITIHDWTDYFAELLDVQVGIEVWMLGNFPFKLMDLR